MHGIQHRNPHRTVDAPVGKEIEVGRRERRHHRREGRIRRIARGHAVRLEIVVDQHGQSVASVPYRVRNIQFERQVAAFMGSDLGPVEPHPRAVVDRIETQAQHRVGTGGTGIELRDVPGVPKVVAGAPGTVRSSCRGPQSAGRPAVRSTTPPVRPHPRDRPGTTKSRPRARNIENGWIGGTAFLNSFCVRGPRLEPIRAAAQPADLLQDGSAVSAEFSRYLRPSSISITGTPDRIGYR